MVLMAFPSMLDIIKVFTLSKIPEFKEVRAFTCSTSLTSTYKGGKIERVKWFTCLWNDYKLMEDRCFQNRCVSDNMDSLKSYSMQLQVCTFLQQLTCSL